MTTSISSLIYLYREHNAWNLIYLFSAKNSQK